MRTRTIINGYTVGNGKWKFESILKYCKRKGIELESASYQEYDINYGFNYKHLDVKTGKVKSESNSDPIKEMLGL